MSPRIVTCRVAYRHMLSRIVTFRHMSPRIVTYRVAYRHVSPRIVNVCTRDVSFWYLNSLFCVGVCTVKFPTTIALTSALAQLIHVHAYDRF